MIDMHRRGWFEFLGDSGGVKDRPIPICSFLFPPLKPGTQGWNKSRERGMGGCQYATGQGRKEIAWRFNQWVGCSGLQNSSCGETLAGTPPALSWTPEVSCRNTPALRRGQSSRETPSFCQCLWICAHTSPIFRLMNSLFFTLSAWNTPAMRKGQWCYKYTSFIFIHELSRPQPRTDERVAMPGRGKAWCKGRLLRIAWWW